MFIKGLMHITKSLSLSQKLCPKAKAVNFQVKASPTEIILKVNYIHLLIDLDDKTAEISADDFEVLICPTTSAPLISQLILMKNKESEAIFTSCIEIKVMMICIDIAKVLKISIKDSNFMLTITKDSKIKNINKSLSGSLISKTEKINTSLTYIQIMSGENVILASPGEISRHQLIVSRNKHSIKLMGELSELYCILPPTGIIIEVPLIKEIILQLIDIPSPQIQPMAEFNHTYLNQPDLLPNSPSSARFVLNFNHVFLKLTFNLNQILELKLYNVYLHNNMIKGILEKYLSSNLKESLDAKDNIFSGPHELVVLVRKLELIPTDSIYEQMIEMNSEYSLFIRIDTLMKKITVISKKPVKVTVINKVLEEFILSLKTIKKSIPKKKNQKREKDYTVDCNIFGGELIIPQNSSSYDIVRAYFDHCKVNVYTGDKELTRPTIFDENVQVYKGKQVMHDEYEDVGPVFCDLVSIIITNVHVETFIQEKTKKLGDVAEIIVDVTAPSAPEELLLFKWKTDSFVGVKFRDAEIKASMVINK